MFENFETPDVLTLMCARYATPKILLLSLWHGADKVKVLSCPREACHYLGSSQAAQKIHKCQELLLEAGMPVESISSVLPDEKEQKETIEPLPRLQNISSKANSDLSEAFFAIQSFETLSVQPKKIEEQSALIPGGILLLEKLLESEEILPRGTFIESIRILLATIKKSVSLLPGISSLDIPWKEKELQQKAIQNLHSYIQNSSIKEIILAFPELYSGFLPLLLQDISLVSLPLILRKKLAFRECNHIVALHKPCFNSHYTQNLLQKAAGEEKFSSSKSLFIQQQEDFFADAMALLQEIPGLKVVPLLDACGHSFFRSFHQSQREVAYSLIKQAEKSKAPLLLSLSPYCAKHLSFMLRKGAWQESAMESKDIYSFLVECLC